MPQDAIGTAATAFGEHALSALGPDITACDREPIHIPGSIQPHGMLLIVDAESGLVQGGAGAIEARLGDAWLHRPVEELLGNAASSQLAHARDTPVLLSVTGIHEALQAVAHRLGGLWLIQFEPASAGASSAEILTRIDDAGMAFERAIDVQALCEEAARVFREITGFDRVMLYRFLDNDSGVVLAEERAAGLDSFLNHHFPASDIPKQARALYIRNRVRVIPDVTYEPQPIRPAEANFATLDLSDIDVRSVSPVHIQYLRNMGVAASASISIVKDGVLWGMVACHHNSPRTLGYTERQICRLLASGLARQVRAKEVAEDYRERLRVRAVEDIVVGRLSDDVDPEHLFDSAGKDLQRMFGADGFAILHGQTLHLGGRCPDGEDVREMASWVRLRGPTPFHSSALSEVFGPASAYRDRASGLLGFTLSFEVPTVLMWFRAEEPEVVNWAGNPHKAATLAPGETLTPRTSFAAWREDVRGRSRRWTAAEIEAAHRLMRTLFEARQNRRIRELNRELTVAVADKDALLGQKDTLIKEVNHRVQNSLQLVVAFLGLQARAEKDETLTRHLAAAQRRLSAVALVHRRLYSDDNVETVDLARYLEDLMSDMRESMDPEWANQLTLDLAPILIPADAAVHVGLILVELVINAQKYAYGGRAGPIAVSLEQHRRRFRLIVADRGGGRTGSRKGFGTRMLDAMVQALGGSMEEGSNAPGLRVIVTAPIEVDAAA